jgi:hypothetical protein
MTNGVVFSGQSCPLPLSLLLESHQFCLSALGSLSRVCDRILTLAIGSFYLAVNLGRTSLDTALELGFESVDDAHGCSPLLAD